MDFSMWRERIVSWEIWSWYFVSVNFVHLPRALTVSSRTQCRQPLGVRHPSITLDFCGESRVKGLRWMSNVLWQDKGVFLALYLSSNRRCFIRDAYFDTMTPCNFVDENWYVAHLPEHFFFLSYYSNSPGSVQLRLKILWEEKKMNNGHTWKNLQASSN